MIRLFRTSYRSIVGMAVISAAALRGRTSMVHRLVKILSPGDAMLVLRLKTKRKKINAFQLRKKISAVSKKLGRENSVRVAVVGLARRSVLSFTAQGTPPSRFGSRKNSLIAATGSMDSEPGQRLSGGPTLSAFSSLCETSSTNFSMGVPEGQASWQAPPLSLCPRSIIAICLGLALRSTLTFASNPEDWKRET